MGQIVGLNAKCKRANLNALSQVGTPALGEYVLVSTDNSMNADGQGNFDAYIMGDGTTSANSLELKKVDNSLSELLKDEYTIAAVINDIKYNVIPNEFTQVFQKNTLTEDINNTVVVGTLQNDGSISGNSNNGKIYCIKNESYSKIEVWANFNNAYPSYANACIIAFFSSEIIDSSHLISTVNHRTFNLSYYTATVPDNTKLICINAGAINGAIYEGQDFIIYRDIRKLEFHKIVDSLVIKDKERALSANRGEELFDSMFHNDAAHARAMQAGRPFMKNVFLDCGRKYFSVANIKRIIDTMYSVDLRNLVLDFSNHNAFRFSLDDMVITIDDGTTYDLAPIVSEDHLTESDMNDIITYAKSKNVSIISGVNLPGHATRLLASFFYNRSSVNLDSETQQQFAAAVTEKYAAYFESKGGTYYYLGGDESGAHAKYGFFMNRMMHIILKHNMIPLVWNDQICRTNQGNVNKPYINDGAICMFWGANNQSAPAIERNNFQQINSSMQIYWTLGPSTKPTVESISNFNINIFHGGSVVRKNIVGAQFCMWMDGVGGKYDLDNDGTDVVNQCLPLIEAFGNTLKTQTGIARISTYRPVRPTAGDFFFDTTLNKPIWYNGINWVDATGTTV